MHPASLEEECGVDGKGSVDWVGLIFLFLGIVLTGVGNCCFWTFGVAYLDDNVRHENSPQMLGITYTFRYHHTPVVVTSQGGVQVSIKESAPDEGNLSILH